MNAQIDMIDLNQWADQTHEYRAKPDASEMSITGPLAKGMIKSMAGTDDDIYISLDSEKKLQRIARAMAPDILASLVLRNEEIHHICAPKLRHDTVKQLRKILAQEQLRKDRTHGTDCEARAIDDGIDSLPDSVLYDVFYEAGTMLGGVYVARMRAARDPDARKRWQRALIGLDLERASIRADDREGQIEAKRRWDSERMALERS